jgi:hypothetical protein
LRSTESRRPSSNSYSFCDCRLAPVLVEAERSTVTVSPERVAVRVPVAVSPPRPSKVVVRWDLLPETWREVVPFP